jgi:hypothetical protein
VSARRGPADPAVEQVVCLLDEAFDHKAWHGPTLGGALRGVNARLAAWRPAPAMHNIWELAVHAAYWKYAVRRTLLGGKRGSFAAGGSNWFVRPPLGLNGPAKLEAAWRADVRLLRHEHRLLRDAVAGLPAASLDRQLPGKAYTLGHLVRGIAAHDLYHAGQVRLLKRLHSARH